MNLSWLVGLRQMIRLIYVQEAAKNKWYLADQENAACGHSDYYLIINIERYIIVRTSPPRRVREMYAQGIVSLFPYLKDPFSENGYVSTLPL